MFKKLATFAVAAVMSLTASSAFAAFANMDLIRVISDTTAGSTKEIVTNLGQISTLTGSTDLVVGGGTSAFTAFTTSSLANLSVTYFAVNRTGLLTGTMWISSNSASTPATPGVAQIQNKLSPQGGTANTPVLAYYNTLTATGSTVVADKNNASSLAGKFGSTTIASYGGYSVNFAGTTDQNLANLTASAPIATALWQFGTIAGVNMALPQTGVQLFTLTTNADGSTTVNAGSAPVVTPIPAAAWLLGSGLMGLVGLRRRKNA